MITVVIDNAVREAGIAAAAAAYNAALPTPPEGETPATLTPEQYAQMVMDGAAESYVRQFKVGTISSGEYVLRFTAAENAAITAAAETDPLIAGLLARVRESAEVVLYAPEVVQGVGYLVAQALLTQARADVILAY
jgi:hypothetical protein